MSDSIDSPLNLSIAKKSATKSSQGNDIKVNDHKSPSATPKIALLLPQKPPVPQKLLRQSQKRKYQQNLVSPEARSTTEIADTTIATNLATTCSWSQGPNGRFEFPFLHQPSKGNQAR
ncbi:hypothetical protein D6C93_10527 [Aureobasidium pullulans]|nr:hypothetical protein D6C93_10527 [Aureobasidium pullulans]